MDRFLMTSHGGKGGVGKSYLATAVSEAVLNHGASLSIIEADPTQPDVAARYSGDPSVTVGALSLNRAGDAENALSRFGEWLEGSNADHVIVNLPAGAGETLDAQGDLLRDLADALGYRLIATYCLEKNRVATEEMLESFGSGLMSFVAPENRYIVIPAYKGDPSTFEWMTHPRRATLSSHEMVFPALGNRAALKKLEATPGRISGLIDRDHRPDGWMILDQSSVYRWYHATMLAIAPIFGGEQV